MKNESMASGRPAVAVSLANTKTMVITALFAALTCVATMVIKIPTPTMGYVHPGDSLVVLCGVMLGPVTGGLAAGIGSMLADIFSGYLIYAIPTLIIKAVTAVIAGVVFQKLRKMSVPPLFALAVGSVLAEINMVAGYFVNKVVKTMFLLTDYSGESFAAGIANAITDAPFNAVQGLVGIILALVIFPVLSKIPDLNRRQ